VALDSQDVDLPARLGRVEDLWTGEAVTTVPVTAQEDATRGVAPGSTAIPVTIAPHGAVLLRHTP
jgi:alpha-galactosidase